QSEIKISERVAPYSCFLSVCDGKATWRPSRVVHQDFAQGLEAGVQNGGGSGRRKGGRRSSSAVLTGGLRRLGAGAPIRGEAHSIPARIAGESCHDPAPTFIGGATHAVQDPP